MIDWLCQNPVFMDVETQSAADLPVCGGRLYARCESTRVLSLVALVDGTFRVWVPGCADPDLESWIWDRTWGPEPPIIVSREPTMSAALEAVTGRTFVAHNAFGFDRFIWERFSSTRPRWADTLYLARLAGLPGGLDDLSRAIGFGAKLETGEKLVKKLCKPGVIPQVGELRNLVKYNIQDVRLLAAAWEHFSEQWVEADTLAAHVAINERGVGVDLELCEKLEAIAGESVSRAGETIRGLTNGILHSGNLRSVKQVTEWLAEYGVRPRDHTGKTTLRKDVVEQSIANPWSMVDADNPFEAGRSIPPVVFDVLRLRSAAVRITGAKTASARNRVSGDGRIRDLFSYHMAATGRWSSSGVQVHNLPRPKKGVDIDRLLEELRSDGQAGELFGRVAALIPKGRTVDDAVSALIRPMLVPSDDACFVISDFASVEARGVAWIAGEAELLSTFAGGGDVYKVMASRIYGVPADAVTDDQRQVGKVVVLGCGYSMSQEKFRIYAGLQGIDLERAGTTAEACVESYRSAYPNIAGTYAGEVKGRKFRRGGVWDQLAKAATTATTEGTLQKAGKCTFVHDGKDLLIYLPSGRPIRYRRARIEDRVPAYCVSLGLEQRTKATLVYESPRGERSLYGGKICENVVQALCRDLMATALVECERAGLPVVLHVHDEIVCEVPLAERDAALTRLVGIMRAVPTWAAGFPVGAEGHAAPRYLKKAPERWPCIK